MAKRVNQIKSKSGEEWKERKPKFLRPDLRWHWSKPGSRKSAPIKIYEVKASRLNSQAYKALIKQANERLRQIEKRGLQSVSREYQLVKMYAENYPKGKGSIYTYDREKGRIRFSSNLKAFVEDSNLFQRSLHGLSPAEREKEIRRAKAERRAYMINTLRNFLTAESSTVSGIKKIRQRAFESFKKKVEENDVLYPGLKDISREQYDAFWSTYREKFADVHDTYGYDKVMRAMRETNLMSLSPERIQEILSFDDTHQADDSADFVEMAVDMFPDLEFKF